MPDTLSLAAAYVNSTARHIFLTGKAGTGKTTFLRNLANITHKSFLVVAPTGSAALNAGGVTIHSQFLLPLGSFLPDKNNRPPDPGIPPTFFNGYLLARKHPLNQVRRQVLRSIDLLVIDEVSMLRADVLDAIDYRLRSVRGNFRDSFGGVQLLLIGDLFQLPPIVKDEEWNYLRSYYPSMHFFEAHGLKQEGYTYIELDKVFRQSDETFISLLNNLRNNACTLQDIDTLNAHYRENTPREEGVITLCTHNYQADRTNQQALFDLEGKLWTYPAMIEGEFPESMYPLPPKLELKVGAQVMFVKNDTLEGRFFNGKLAKVSRLTNDEIAVILDGEKGEFVVEQMDWENKRYLVNETTKELDEEVIGVFRHYPIKLAWAITVHKSQGLTFDKAVIDVGQAFAPGQVYVALSRLRTLEGLTLHSRIHAGAISSDGAVLRFATGKGEPEVLSQQLQGEQLRYLRQVLVKTFDFEAISRLILHVQQQEAHGLVFEDAAMQTALKRLREKVEGEQLNCKKFQGQIQFLIESSDFDRLRERVEKGSSYYLTFLYECLYDLLLHLEEVKLFARTRTYAEALTEVDQLLSRQIAEVQKSASLTQSILTESPMPPLTEAEADRKAIRTDFLNRIRRWIEENPKKGMNKTGKVKGEKVEKGKTHEETLALLLEGKSTEEVAKIRKLTVSTIEGHAAKAISAGKLELKAVMPQAVIDDILTAFENEVPELAELNAFFKGKYEYGRLRMVREHVLWMKKSGEE